MKYIGGIILLFYAASAALGWDRFPDDDRGALPPGVRGAAILMWHDGFMGGK